MSRATNTRIHTSLHTLSAWALSGVLSLGMAAPGFAAEPSAFGNRDMDAPVDLSASYRLPAALAAELKVAESDGALRGTFAALNGETSALGGLRYHMEVWGAGALDGMLFARETSAESFTLAGGGRTEMDFSMNAPQLPAGDYTFRIQIVTDKGRSLGWADAPLKLSGGAPAFAYAAPAAVVLPEFGNEAVDPMAGPNVSPEGTVTLRSMVENKGSEPMTLIPMLRTSHFDAARGVIGETAYPAITVAPGELKAVELPVKAAMRAEVYSGLLYFTDATTKAPVSSLSEFRWVVRGADADTLPFRTRSMGTKQGEQAVFEVAFVGAPDAQTVTEAIPTIRLMDDLGVAAELTLPKTELTDAIRSGVANLTLTRDLVGSPSVQMTIRDLKGAVLDEHREAIAFGSNPLAAFPMSSVLLALIVLASMGLLAQGMRLGRNWKVAMPGTLAGGTAAMMLFLQLGPAMAAGNGNGIEVFTPAPGSAWHGHGAPAVVALFISAPQHDAAAGTYAKHNVPLQYKVTFGVCENRISHVKVIGRFDANGGKQSTLEGTNANWQTVHHADYQAGPTCDAGYSVQSPQGIETCLFDRTFNGTVDLSGLSPNACSTTLQLIAKLGQSGLDTNSNQPGPPTAAIDRNDVTFRTNQVHAVNLWLNFCAQQTKPQCSDNVDNDGDGAVDAHDIGCYVNGQYNPNDNDESNPVQSSSSSSSSSAAPLPQCSDGRDNDGDGTIDYGDPGCYTNGQYNPNDNDETNVVYSSASSVSSSSSSSSSVPAYSSSSSSYHTCGTWGCGASSTPGIHCGGGSCGGWTTNVNMNANTSVNNQVNAGAQNNTQIWQQQQAHQPWGGWQTATVNPTATTTVNNQVNAGSQNTYNAWNPWSMGATHLNANTGVNNGVNAAAQNNTQVYQQQQAHQPWGGWQAATVTPTASTTVNNGVNAASQNTFNGWWW